MLAIPALGRWRDVEPLGRLVSRPRPETSRLVSQPRLLGRSQARERPCLARTTKEGIQCCVNTQGCFPASTHMHSDLYTHTNN